MGKIKDLGEEMNKKIYWIDFTGFTLIALMCFGYVIGIRHFAELHIQLSFLNFPIFIGEILVFLCSILYFVKSLLQKKEVNFYFATYICFVLIKTFSGYLSHGPLALRHAALFYYPCFIVFTYSFFRPVFVQKLKYFILFAMTTALFMPEYNGYFTFTFAVLASILIMILNEELFFLVFLVMLFTGQYMGFYFTSRMMMVSNLAAGVFVILCLGKQLNKLAVYLLLILFVSGFLLAGRTGAYTSTVDFKKVFTELVSYQKVLNAQQPEYTRWIIPFRSISLEVLQWIDVPLKTEGWIGAHNSFFNMVYRAGVVGCLMILVYLTMLYDMVLRAIKARSVIGILLCGVIVNWFVAANFLLILELPYTAIPIWSLYGLAYKYMNDNHPKEEKGTNFFMLW